MPGGSAANLAFARLLGRVVQRDQRLSLVVELVDARDDHQLWGMTYDVARRILSLYTERSPVKSAGR